MAIMQSCCCWQSVRKGSFVCAIYTAVYFSLVAMTTGALLQAENEYLKGNRPSPETSSLLESGTISPVTLQFNIILLACSCCGVLSSFLLLYGLFKDKRALLVPWIVTVIMISGVDIGHSMYMLSVTSNFNPIQALLYTLSFFLFCLNVYAVLCVISQFQELSAGRGTAADEYDYRAPAVRYVAQPTTTATSCLSSRRTGTITETKITATPTQSPTTGQNILPLVKIPPKPPRKHVQFPDVPPMDDKVEIDLPIREEPTEAAEFHDVRLTLNCDTAIPMITISRAPPLPERSCRIKLT